MPQTILHKRGSKENLPELLESEIGFTTDTKELFVGSDKGNVRLLTEQDDQRTVVFILPGEVITGIADPRNVISYKTKVLGIDAYVANKSDSDLTFDIEYSNDFEVWSKLTAGPVRIAGGSYAKNEEIVLNTESLSEETALRVNVVQSGNGARNLTINIKIIKQ